MSLSQTFEGKAKPPPATPPRRRRPEAPAAQHQHQRRHLRLRAGEEARPDRLGHGRDHQLAPERSAPRFQPEPDPRSLARARSAPTPRDFDPFLQSVSASFCDLGEHLPVDRLDLRAGRQGRSRRSGATRSCPPPTWRRAGDAPGPARSSTRPGSVPRRPGLLGQLQLQPEPAPGRTRLVAQAPRPQSLGFNTSFSPDAVLVAVLVLPVQHHRRRVRVPGRPAGARSARVAGGLQLRAERRTATSRSTSRST